MFFFSVQRKKYTQNNATLFGACVSLSAAHVGWTVSYLCVLSTRYETFCPVKKQKKNKKAEIVLIVKVLHLSWETDGPAWFGHTCWHTTTALGMSSARVSFFSLLEVVILLSPFLHAVVTRRDGLPVFRAHTLCCCCWLDHVRRSAVLDLLSWQQAGNSSTGNIVLSRNYINSVAVSSLY